MRPTQSAIENRHAFVVGTPHVLQELCVRKRANTNLERRGKAGFEQMMRGLLATWQCDLIAEEASYARPYVGKKLAEEFGCEYTNINLTEYEKSQLGILTGDDWMSGKCNAEEFNIDQLKKDEYMFARLKQRASGKDKILVICGPLHIKGLEQRLKALGYEVSTRGVRCEPWYLPAMDSGT